MRGKGGTGLGQPPPQASQTAHGTDGGHAAGHRPPGTALPAPCTGTTRGARATPTRGGGKGADAPRARAHALAKDTRGIPEGQPDRACGTHRPHGMVYQRVRVRYPRTGRPATRSAGNAGREKGDGEDTKPGAGPGPPDLPRALRTHKQGTAPAKAEVARRATHKPRG